jgi:phosphatidylglycerophosphatase A
LAVIGLSIWASNHAEVIYGEHDSGKIVVDEFAGILATGFLIPQTWQWAIAVFVVFRFFDILKPPPIRQIDRSLGGGAGVVLDDVVAGIMACITLHLAKVVIG